MDSDKPVRARLLPGYPLSIVLGGFEHQCVQTCHALSAEGCDAKFLAWDDPNGTFDLLHLFGGAAAWHELVAQASCSMPVVITALYCPRRKRLAHLANHAAAFLSGLIPQQRTEFQLVRKMLQSSAAVICLNDAHRQALLFQFGLDARRIHVIPNGVPLSRFYGDPRLFARQYGVRDYVLFVGNIVERKNPLLLAQVLKQRGWPGVFVGGTVPSEAAYADHFRAFVAETPGLKWVPALDYSDPLLDSAFAGAKAFCLPSAMESQPLSAMEALAAGTPVLMPELPYAHQAPFEKVQRFAAGDPHALESALAQVLASPGAASERLPQSYTWSAVAKQVLAVYRQALSEHAGGKR